MARMSEYEVLSKKEKWPGNPWRTRCLFCCEEKTQGGFWVGGEGVTFVCSECAAAGSLGALLADAVADRLLTLQPPFEGVERYGGVVRYLQGVLTTTERDFWRALFLALWFREAGKHGRRRIG